MGGRLEIIAGGLCRTCFSTPPLLFSHCRGPLRCWKHKSSRFTDHSHSVFAKQENLSDCVSDLRFDKKYWLRSGFAAHPRIPPNSRVCSGAGIAGRRSNEGSGCVPAPPGRLPEAHRAFWGCWDVWSPLGVGSLLRECRAGRPLPAGRPGGESFQLRRRSGLLWALGCGRAVSR